MTPVDRKGILGEKEADGVMSVLPLQKAKREAAAQRRPARSERKKPRFSVKQQAAWFETLRVSN
ncbi:MAG: hypothetical protein MSH25_02265 [Desulfovibrio sp.]|uniref:hypothetical protein n=1 Tax=Desulfovibrio sp. TaxID=885 RepID=UPI0025B7D541|nr:hypothetical protein [Desulfovibrio sp.]MCI7568186.1 hypothetical protein [Desulfovibrio sp.]